MELATSFGREGFSFQGSVKQEFLILSFVLKDTARHPGFGFGKGDSAASVLVVPGLRFSQLLWYLHQLFVSTYSHGQKLLGEI